LRINEELNNSNSIASNLGNIGIIYYEQSDYPKAFESYFKSLKIYEELNDKKAIATNSGNIGIIYSDQSDYPKALEYYFKALKINEELNDKRGIAINSGNIGNIYAYQSDYPKALDYYFKALKINEELNDKRGIAINSGNIGSIYTYQSDYPKALEYYFKALKINKELNYKSGITYNLENIGELYIKLSEDTIYDKIHETNELVGLTKEINLKKGIEYLFSSEKICKEINDLKLLKTISQNLYDGYKRQGNYLKALEYHEQYKTMQDSVFNIEKAKKFATLEAKRETQLKEKEIERQKAVINANKWQLFGSLSVILLLIVFSFFVFLERRKSEKLLLNILPLKIAKRLKKKENTIADSFDSASVVFIDIVDFTKSSTGIDPKRVVEVLNVLYTKLDKIAQKYGLEKIKTIGDCYMAASGIPEIRNDNAEMAAKFALESMNLLKDYDTGGGVLINFRCGVDCGPVVAGVIGENKFIYDLWGDAVNTASRMESNGVAGKIQVTERFKEKITNIEQGISNIEFEERGEIEIKGKGMMKTYFLNPVYL
jgi:class 3 adenylate cyclase